MIESITIRGFKSIVEATVPLGKLNVLIGANGAGKSNLLEAIGLLGCAVSGRVDEAAFRFRNVRPGAPALFKTAFDSNEIPRVIRLEARAGSALYRVALDNPVKRPSPLWRFHTEAVDGERRRVGARGLQSVNLYDSAGARLDDVNADVTQGIVPLVRAMTKEAPDALLDALEAYAIFTPYTPILRGLMPEPAPREAIGLNGGGIGDALSSLERQDKGAYQDVVAEVLALVDWATSIDVGARGSDKARALLFGDGRMRKGRDILAAVDASEGALYVLFLLLLLRHPGAPGFFAVDNIDSVLHPRLARALIARVQRVVQGDADARQLIVTTHNPLVLDALELADDRVRLFVVSRESGTGFTVVRRIEHSAALERSIERGRTLSQLWVEGTLGGVPKLS